MNYYIKYVGALVIFAACTSFSFIKIANPWQPKLVTADSTDVLTYEDKPGNTLPDFNMVGYHQIDKSIPDVPVAKLSMLRKTGWTGNN